MAGERRQRAVRHRALREAEPSARPLVDSGLPDRVRLAVLLQGAGLLSLLDRAAWHLGHGWRGARVTPGGLLTVSGATAGPPRAMPQERLRDLLTLLFGDEVAGRGDARRVARDLSRSWQQSLTPMSADDLVAQLLDAAPFLWLPAAAHARRTLAGDYLRGATRVAWVAGRARWRARLLERAVDVPGLEALLADPGAESVWKQSAQSSGAAGSRIAIAARGERQPPVEVADRLELGHALAGLGKYRRALAAVEGVAEAAAVLLLRASCQAELGELAAAREQLRRATRLRLTPEETATAAELAADVHAGDGRDRERFLAAALGLPVGEPLWRAQVLAAAVPEATAADRQLEAARPLLSRPLHAWRWHRVRAQRAAQEGDWGTAIDELARALRGSRRHLTRSQAGSLWSQLARARARAETLAGAERASGHAVRLFKACDGDRRLRGALYRLAELRLRRGQTLGVGEILDASIAAHARAGDHRGAAFDAVLRARLDLVRGQPHAALAGCRAALADLERRGLEHGRAELAALAVRALGWLGARDEAAAELATLPPAALSTVESEERPALFALAGQTEAALAEAAGTPFARLWHAALTGHAAPESVWMELRTLDRYRAARLVLDLELAAPGVTPLYWLRRSAATLQRVGAEPLALRLEPRRRGGWEALETYLRSGEPGALPELFFAAGYPEARLLWSRGRSERVLVDGSGGAEELSAAAAGGQLSLRAPLVDPTLRALFAVALRDLDAAGPRLVSTDSARGGAVGENPSLLAALERAALLAPGELPVLILGETGTGKELVARQMHTLSRRAAGPFAPLNCAAVSEHLLLSELFGHARGAFTGADRERAGVFESARGGTVFLDEIGDLPPNAQGMLLRALQEGEIRRVGESLPRRIDVRIVAATHRDLVAMVRAAAFRQDLFYRLRGATITLPPLRDRGDDVILLAEAFLARSARPARLSARARAALLGHSWPGNIRELRNAIEMASTLAAGKTIQPEHLELPQGAARAAANYHQRVDAVRRELVADALAQCGGRRAEAARRLGLTRQALSYLIKQLAI